jgi:hypothetical protein
MNWSHGVRPGGLVRPYLACPKRGLFRSRRGKEADFPRNRDYIDLGLAPKRCARAQTSTGTPGYGNDGLNGRRLLISAADESVRCVHPTPAGQSSQLENRVQAVLLTLPKSATLSTTAGENQEGFFSRICFQSSTSNWSFPFPPECD